MKVKRSNFTDVEILSALENNGWNIADAAAALSDLGNGEVSPQLLRYWSQHIKRRGPKILIFDIETTPILAYVWGLWKQNVGLNQIVEDWKVLMWAAKWLDSDEGFYDALQNKTELDVVTSLWELLDEADIVVAHNAVAFDVKKMNAKFLQFGLGIPSHYKIVDTLKIAKDNFNFTSNKLDYITRLMGHEGKLKIDMQLWIDCMNGDEKAWKDMIAYCLRDVEELESVYKDLRGWDKRHPSWGSYNTSDKLSCNVCGSENIEFSNYYHTAVSSFETYQCKDCGHQQRSRTNVAERENKQVNI